MVYEDYKTASIRHLRTCQHLCQNLGQVQNTQVKKHILANIYYLSGYVIECIINYAIYDLVSYSKTEDVKQLNESSHQISFYKPKKKGWYQINHHKFQENSQFLVSQLPAISQIPFIDWSNKPEKYRSVERLYEKWQSNARYEDHQFTEQQVKLFVQLVEEIHLKIRQIISKG